MNCRARGSSAWPRSSSSSIPWQRFEPHQEWASWARDRRRCAPGETGSGFRREVRSATHRRNRGTSEDLLSARGTTHHPGDAQADGRRSVHRLPQRPRAGFPRNWSTGREFPALERLLGRVPTRLLFEPGMARGRRVRTPRALRAGWRSRWTTARGLGSYRRDLEMLAPGPEGWQGVTFADGAGARRPSWLPSGRAVGWQGRRRQTIRGAVHCGFPASFASPTRPCRGPSSSGALLRTVTTSPAPSIPSRAMHGLGGVRADATDRGRGIPLPSPRPSVGVVVPSPGGRKPSTATECEGSGFSKAGTSSARGAAPPLSFAVRAGST